MTRQIKNSKIKNWLLGEIKELPKNKLPSIGDVLKAYYYNHSVLKNVKQNSIIIVTKEVINIWKACGKATCAQKNVARKLGGLINKIELLKKSKSRKSKAQALKEKEWKNSFKNCYDITPQEANNTKNVQRKSKKIGRVERPTLTFAVSEEEFSTDESLSDEGDDEDGVDFCNDLSAYHKKQLPEQRNSSVLETIINSPDVSSALDRTLYDSGKFAILAAAIGRACGDNISDEVFSLSTIKRRREVHRRDLANEIRNDFDRQDKKKLVVHWDGKNLKDFTNPDKACVDEKVERFGVVVNGLNVNKIITVARLEDGTGLTMSEKVYEALQSAGVIDNIFGMCTDTTASNTGHIQGACIRFEKKLNKDILYFACQHHVHEVILGRVYQELFGYTKAPTEALFLKLKNCWSKLEHRNAYKAMDSKIFTSNKQRCKLRLEAKTFILSVLATPKSEGYFPQDNYREILELSLLVMGHSLPQYEIKKPGACNKARWMAPAIYAMKIYLLRDQMDLTPDVEENLKEFCLFVCLIYVKSWTLCQIPSQAPENTLQLYKNLRSYSSLNKTISELGLAKLTNHLWYIGHEMIFLSLFSSNVKQRDKSKIFNQMVAKDQGWTQRNRKLKDVSGLHKKQLHELVGPSSLSALKVTGVDIQFMYEFDAAQWSEIEQYKIAKEEIDTLKVVNDVAERSVKLMTDINGKFTKNEAVTQQIIQVVEDNRKRIPSTKKSTLSSYQQRH